MALQAFVAPQKVFLFSGHMIDQPGREEERFPEDMKDLVAAAIAAKLDELGAGDADLAICEGACGGDLLFAQAALDRRLHVELRLPFDEPEFLQNSVAYAGPEWVARYYKIKEAADTKIFLMPRELGATPPDCDPYERANLWLLDTALGSGAERVRFIALWNGVKSGKRGGTDHMIEAVRKRGGRAYVIDTKPLLEAARSRR
jgi:hypothetical protein